MPGRFHQNGNRSRKRGMVLFLVFVIVGSLSVFGGLLMLLVIERYLHAQLEVDRAKAFFLAEAGIAQAIHELKTKDDTDGNGLGNIASRPLGDGIFQATHYAQTGEIRATGTVNDVSRSIQIKYAVN